MSRCTKACCNAQVNADSARVEDDHHDPPARKPSIQSAGRAVLKNGRLPEDAQAIAQQGVAKTHEFYKKSVAAAQESTKVLTEVADTAWGSTKMLNEKLAQNLTANIEASFIAAHAIAKAQSLPEALQLHTEFFQRLAKQTTEQTKEFFDLSTRATQHVFEQVQAAVAKAMKPVA